MPELVRTYIERNITGSWSDISAYVVGDISYEYRIPSNEEDEKLASVGQLKLVMNNQNDDFSTNSNFRRGTPIRVRTEYDTVSKTRFLGTILKIDPDTEEVGNQYCRVTVVDWLNFAIDHPMIVPELQADMTVDEAVAYILAHMDKQPESVTYHEGRETFDFVFDTIKKETKAYSELNKLALSEFAPIYLRAGNVLVVESADTRHGQRELTQVPVSPSNSGWLATADGCYLLTADGNPIRVNQIFAPNFVSGTHGFTDIEAPEDVLLNRVLVRAYPTQLDVSPVLLWQLDVGALNLPIFGTVTIRGNWANPDGGAPINAVTSDFSPMITGTNYVAFSEIGQDISQNLVITERYGTEGFEHTVFNNGVGGFITKFDIFGIGIYGYNPTEAVASITGSISNYGIAQLTIDQKYQDNLLVGASIADSILDRDKEPRIDTKSITFEASSDHYLMQTSQYIDTGDLIWFKNVKPAIDSYGYIQGRKTIITPAGWVTEKFYLKQTESLRKGYSPLALNYSGVSGSMNGVTLPYATQLNQLTEKTYMSWVYLKAPPSALGHVLMAKATEFSGDVLWLSAPSNVGKIQYNGLFSTPGTWRTTNDVISNLTGTWAHIAVTMVVSHNYDPVVYVNGVSQPITEIDTPAGSLVDDSLAPLTLGNFATRPVDYLGYALNAVLKDIRVYNRALSQAEIQEIYNSPNDYFTVPDGLVFQGIAVYTEDLNDYIGQPISTTMKLIDNMYDVRATATYKPTSASFQLKGADPSQAGYP